MKSKFVFGLLAMMLVLALAPSSFAQVNLQAFGNASDSEITTNRTAQTADPKSSGAGLLIAGSAIATATVTQTTLFVDYPANVTSSTAIPAGDAVRIEGATGLFATAAISSINFVTGVVEITLPGCLPPPAAPGTGCLTPGGADPSSGSFRLVGVRVDANGLTAPVSAALSLSSSSNNYILSTSSVAVINAVGAGIGSMAVGVRSGTNTGTGTILTTGAASDPTGALVIGEGFASAWRTSVQSSTQSASAVANGTGIRLTFAGVPTGVTITLTTTNSSSTLGTPSLTNTSITPTALTTQIDFPSTSLTATETVQLNMTFSSTTTAPAPGAITVTATMAPIGAALSGGNAATAADGYPRFAQADVGPVTVASIVSATTTLLVPFAVRDLGFDTGISLANTTADPFGTGGGATASGGTLRVDFFPRAATGGAGTTFSLTTSATTRPGIGLSSDGTLAAGATWTVLLSELLTAAGQTGSFTGYMFIQTNFLNAHGSPFVSDFRNFTSFSPMLVLPPPIATSRSGEVGLSF
jgi:hypothetical protein